MKIKASLWDSTKTRILAVENFSNIKELQDFMKELHIVEPKATYRIMEVAKWSAECVEVVAEYTTTSKVNTKWFHVITSQKRKSVTHIPLNN